MQKFELTIFRQSRVLVGLFLTPISLIGILILCAELNNIFIGLVLFPVYVLTVYYFVVGHLTVSINNEQLKFRWTRKLIFNYDDIEPVNIADIKTIVIDSGQLLRKIITADRTIKINNAKVQVKDANKFIYQLGILTKRNDVREIDSWDEWSDKGYIKTAYRINTVILVLATIIVTTFIIIKGFNSRNLFLVLLFIPQLYLYGKQMKRKIKNDNR
ncbi:hypothetical protein Q73A0000_03880 [Kaistella flava (ex Peng et al. 2021)]|uniref:Uncharacterized protein n=1 Tax=Kaistella flava (ex Peng et al. 2021) TaxID=2038776 RepID=A0A7M2Y895_9FLAO|nr:hypothetical protein [Kaistella flava (ex Peng et al. 2021)]QOW09563.1 hypothetical protein Q73A0000_03880 [Kaistella flava (ex Peng et al. 2021)]